MNLFKRPRTVAIALRAGNLTEREKLHFFWVVIFLNNLIAHYSLVDLLLNLARSPLWGALQLVPLGIAIWGIWSCAEINRRGDNRQFIERFICLDAAVSLRIYPFFLLLQLLVQLFGSRIFGSIALLPFLLLTTAVTIGLTFYWFHWLRSLIAAVATESMA